MINDWIRSAEARDGGAAYLEHGRGTGTLSYAGLGCAARAWARALDDAGVPPGAGVAIRLADPLGYATTLVATLAAGRVAVPLDPGAPAARLGRVLEVARPAAAVCDSPAGLPPGLAVLPLPGRGMPAGRLGTPGGGRGTPGGGRGTPAGGRGTPGRRPGSWRRAGPRRDRRDLPVHERDHGHAEGHPAHRGPAVPRGGHGGRPPPAHPRRPRLLPAPAVPRQRRGGGPARHPQRRGGPGPGRQVQPARLLGAGRRAPDHLDQRGTGDHHAAGGRAGRAGPAPGPVRPLGVGAAGPGRAGPVRGRHRRRGPGDLRHDRGGQHDRGQPAGRAAQAQLGRAARPGSSCA